MPIKVTNNVGYGTASQSAEGIRHAVDKGAHIINMSLGFRENEHSTILTTAINEAINNDVTIVAATGNDGSNIIDYPAKLPGVIAVGASSANDVKLSWSNYSAEVDLVAPGAAILTGFWDDPDDGIYYSGTSYAAPMVAGAAALLLSLDPDMTKDEVENYLKEGADTIDTGNANFYGSGRLNIYNSLIAATKYEFIKTTWTRNDIGWNNISFSRSFTNPIVVASPLTNYGSDPAHIRIRNVTSTGFQYTLEEWDYLDGSHATNEVAHFMVMERGIHTIGGVKWEAGTKQVNHQFKTVTLDTSFGGGQTIIPQVTTTNGSQAVVVRIRNISGNSFEMKLQEEEGNDGTHSNETVHYIALWSTSGSDGIMKFKAGKTNNVNNNLKTVNYNDGAYNSPFFFAQISTYNGADPCGLRRGTLGNRRVDIFVEEEGSLNAEVAHVNEVVNWLVVSFD